MTILPTELIIAMSSKKLVKKKLNDSIDYRSGGDP